MYIFYVSIFSWCNYHRVALAQARHTCRNRSDSDPRSERQTPRVHTSRPETVMIVQDDLRESDSSSMRIVNGLGAPLNLQQAEASKNHRSAMAEETK